MFKTGILTLVLSVLAYVKAGDWDDGNGGEDYQCPGLFEYDASSKVRVTSPYYGKREEYHNDLLCEYRIKSPEGMRIKMTFEDLDLQPSARCEDDKLVVYSKNKTSVLGIFCGSQIPYPILSEEGENEIRLLFQTDFLTGGRGFSAIFESGHNLRLCKEGQSVCGNRNCYDNSKKCDGNDECGDGTDEENCGSVATTQLDCGKTPIEPNTIYSTYDRMVGGEAARPNSWPWQASLQMAWIEPNGHFCGGVLINADWILTATHCVRGMPDPNPERIRIHLGAHSKWRKSSYEQVRKAAKIINDIRPFGPDSDLTLIKLNAPVKFSDGVQPACLAASGSEVHPGMLCYVTGWGETRGSGFDSALKQQEQVVQPASNCVFFKDIHICVQKPNNSPCHGDSGGPLSCKVENKWYVFGVASFVTTNNFITGLCTGPGAMTVYAKVAAREEWIRTTINKYS